MYHLELFLKLNILIAQVYWVGPLAGGVIAGLLYKYVLRIGKDETGSYDL